MKILTLYIFRQILSSVVLILFSLCGIVWIALALRQLNIVVANSQSVLTLFEMTTLGLPNFIAIIAPVALLLGVIHTLNRLGGDSELIIISSSGAQLWTLIKPIVAISLVMAIAISFINHFANPWSSRVLKDLIVKVRTDLVAQVLQPGRFSSPDPGLTLHIRDRDQTGLLLGLMIHDERDPRDMRTFFAQRAQLVEQDGATYLEMLDGHILIKTEPTAPSTIIVYDRMVVDLDTFQKKSDDRETGERKPRELYLDELRSARSETTDKALKGRYTAEIHERFSSPLYTFAFVAICMALLGQPKTIREGRTLRTGLAFSLAIAVRISGLAVNNIATIDPTLFWLLYAVPLMTIAVSMALPYFSVRDFRYLAQQLLSSGSPRARQRERFG